MLPCPRLLATLLCTAAAPLWAGTAATCQARSLAQVVPVVELYTSEGCSSCPPADRWLSTLAAGSPTVALAFHVDYWDRLGWVDRFAKPEHTRRQAEQQAVTGARFSYTPQVVIDGRDRTDWHALATPPVAPSPRAATVAIAIEQRGESFYATVTPGEGAPVRLAAYWAVTEDRHVSAVRAGENQGATLRHDHVVREYVPIAAWAAGAPTTLAFHPARPADAATPRQVNLVVVDAATGRPLQALKLGC